LVALRPRPAVPSRLAAPAALAATVLWASAFLAAIREAVPALGWRTCRPCGWRRRRSPGRRRAPGGCPRAATLPLLAQARVERMTAYQLLLNAGEVRPAATRACWSTSR
jgi:hypothetical protein